MKKNVLPWIVLLLIPLLAVLSVAQAEKNKYTPTEIQSLRLKVAQQAALLAQRDANEAQQRFQTAIAEFRKEADKVKAENKWPEGVTFDMGSLSFSAPPPPPPPPPAPPKEEKKP